MQIFLEGKLLNFMQHVSNQADLTLKSRTIEGLTRLCPKIQLSSKNI